MNKHTPGPWVAEEHPAGGWNVISLHIEGADTVIVEMLTEANARLIAAAPDLLAALESLLRLPPKDRSSIEVEMDIEAAITRAKGEQS